MRQVILLSVLGALYGVACAAKGNVMMPCSGEDNGNVVIQAEDTMLTSSWKFMNDVPGFTGRGYVTWFGDNEYEFNGVGILKYRMCVTGGTYRVNIWSMRLRKDELRNDEGNDAWIRVESRDEWIKLFTSFGDDMNTWKLSMLFDLEGSKEEPMITLKPGCQYFEVAARSEMYSLDRFILVKTGSDIDLGMEQVGCDGGSPTMPTEKPTMVPVNPTAPPPRGIPEQPKCEMFVPEPQSGERTPVEVTFTNRKSYPIVIYKRTLAGELEYLKEVQSMGVNDVITVDAMMYDMFSAAKLDGRCVRNMMRVGVNGKMWGDKTRYWIAGPN